MAERRRGRRQKGSAGSASGRVFGVHACRAIIDQRPAAIRQAWLLDSASGSALKELAAQLEQRGIAVSRVARTELDALTDDGSHQGIILEVQSLKELSLTEFEDVVIARGSELRLLLLDQVEDPRNLGACLRCAAAAGHFRRFRLLLGRHDAVELPHPLTSVSVRHPALSLHRAGSG